MILSGQIDFMLLFMFLLVITRVYAPFDQALALIAEMFMSQVSASRLMEIYDAKTADGDDSFAPTGHDIVFENVGFAYDNEQVLRGVSFTTKEGEVTALVGPSGSGKSTCARLAARLWDIDSGTIRVGGVNIAEIDPETLLTEGLCHAHRRKRSKAFRRRTTEDIYCPCTFKECTDRAPG